MTALAPELTASHLQAVTQIVSSQGFNIETVTRLSGHPELNGAVEGPKRSCVQFGLKGQMLDATAMRAACLRLSAELSVDVAQFRKIMLTAVTAVWSVLRYRTLP